jgi:hypothetical protein
VEISGSAIIACSLSCVYKWPIYPISNPCPVYSSHPQIVTVRIDQYVTVSISLRQFPRPKPRIWISETLGVSSDKYTWHSECLEKLWEAKQLHFQRNDINIESPYWNIYISTALARLQFLELSFAMGSIWIVLHGFRRRCFTTALFLLLSLRSTHCSPFVRWNVTYTVTHTWNSVFTISHQNSTEFQLLLGTLRILRFF